MTENGNNKCKYQYTYYILFGEILFNFLSLHRRQRESDIDTITIMIIIKGDDG